MFNLMKEYHKKFNKLNNLKLRTKDNENLKQKVLTNVGNIYNELYDIYKSKYKQKIDKLSTKNKKKFDYKKLRLSDNYLYLSEKEQEEEQEEQEKQNKKTTDLSKFNEWTNKKETDINRKLFKNHFFFQTPSELLKNLYKTNDKEENGLLVNVINNGLEDLKKLIRCLKKKKTLKSQIR